MRKFGGRAFARLSVVTTTTAVLVAGGVGALPVQAAPQWGLVSPADSPSGRYDAAMAYDSATSQLVLFGGYNGAALGDTWVWDGTDWAQKSPATQPPARYGASMAYDPNSGKVVLFGGFTGSGALADTWLWDGSNWTHHLETLGHPFPSTRFGASMAFDSKTGTSGEVVLFGGNHSGAVADTWGWDGSGWVALSSVHHPTPRYQASMAPDTDGHLVLFGGYDGATGLADTWQWDGTDWTPLAPAHHPPARQQASMALDGATGQVVLFGGYDGSSYLDDTWVWDGSDWMMQLRQLAVLGGDVAGRRSASMAFDAASGQLVLFGGNVSGAAAHDTHVWHLAASTPTITNLPVAPKVGDGFTATVSTNGDGTKSVASASPTVCTVTSGLTVSFVGVGTCKLTAHVAAGAAYLAATGAEQDVTVAAAGGGGGGGGGTPTPTPTPTATPTTTATPTVSPTTTSTSTVVKPTITAGVTSAQRKTRGWYRSPVTITFTCTPGSSPLAFDCPAPVTLSASRSGGSVTAKVAGTDGGIGQVTVGPFRIDLDPPTLAVTGRHARNCKATDALSGVLSCLIHRRTTSHGRARVVNWTAVATDVAGNKKTKRGKYTLH